MSGLIILFAVLIAIAVLDALALTFGVDSRPDFHDPRAPERGLTT